MNKLLIICALPFLFNCCYSQEHWNTSIENHFLIVASTKNYASAVKSAQSIAEELNLDFSYNEEYADKTHGLTYSKIDCEDDGWGYPCYQPRGGLHTYSNVSIEWSSMYEGFSEGYYIVVIMSSYNKADAKNLLKKAQELVPSAYIKTTSVWYGCDH